MRSVAVIIALVWAAPLLPGPQEARAETTKILLVDTSNPQVDSRLRREVLQGLATGLHQEGHFQVQIARPHADNAAPKIARLLARAKTASEQFQEARARQLLQEAEDLFRETFVRRVTIDALVQVLLAKAKLLSEMKDVAAVEATLMQLVALNPGQTLDPGRFAPPLIKSFKRLKAHLNRQKMTLTVVTQPDAGQPVWVDGRPVGRSPVSVPVLVGEHFVAAGPQGATMGRAVEIAPGPPTTVRLTLPRHAPPSVEDLRARGERQGAGWVAATRLAPVGGRLQIRIRLVSCRTVDPIRTLRSDAVARVQLTWATSKLAIQLKDALALPAVAGSKPGPSGNQGQPSKKEGGSVLTTWWFWTGVAAVVGGGVAAAVVLTREDDPGVRLRMVR